MKAPDIPRGVKGLDDDTLYALHAEVGAYREHLREQHRKILDEVHERESAAAVSVPAASGGTVGTTNDEKG